LGIGFPTSLRGIFPAFLPKQSKGNQRMKWAIFFLVVLYIVFNSRIVSSGKLNFNVGQIVTDTIENVGTGIVDGVSKNLNGRK